MTFIASGSFARGEYFASSHQNGLGQPGMHTYARSFQTACTWIERPSSTVDGGTSRWGWLDQMHRERKKQGTAKLMEGIGSPGILCCWQIVPANWPQRWGARCEAARRARLNHIRAASCTVAFCAPQNVCRNDASTNIMVRAKINSTRLCPPLCWDYVPSQYRTGRWRAWCARYKPGGLWAARVRAWPYVKPVPLHFDLYT